ncbi:MAG TPA: helix-turn-helix domain-containing protein [Thermoanaerobaculia bacterium]
MAIHPEERRIAGLLRELIVQSGVSLDRVEQRLGWAPGRLLDLLDGRLRLSFEDVLEILPLLNTTPTDFFAWLYGFDPKDENGVAANSLAATASPAQRVIERRFETSLRVVREAVARRAAWKREQAESD